MLEPSGPLPASVYWRRRAIAVGGAVAALVMMVWALGALIGSAQPAPGMRNTANERALSLGAARSSAQQESSAPGAPGSVPFDSAAPGASQISGAPESGSPESSGVQQGASAGGAPSRGKPLPACGPADLRLDARVSKPDYKPTEQPRFQLAVTNTGSRNCYIDLSRDRRALAVLSDGRHRWSSSDCYFGHAGEEIHRLNRGEAIAYDITWLRRTSAPGCAAERADVPPGRYALVGRIGKLISAPTLFVLHPAKPA